MSKLNLLCFHVKIIGRDRSHILSLLNISRSIDFLSIGRTLHSSALSGIGKQESLSHQQTNDIKLVTLEVEIKHSFSSNKMQSHNFANKELNINIVGHQWQIDICNSCLFSFPLDHSCVCKKFCQILMDFSQFASCWLGNAVFLGLLS